MTSENLEEYTPQDGEFVEVSEGVFRIQGFHGDYKRVRKPPEEQCNPIRKMCLAIILEYYTENQRPIQVRVARRMLLSRIKKMRDRDEGKPEQEREWQWKTWVPGHNFVERRINDLANPKDWAKYGDGGVLPCVHAGHPKSNYYMPNPKRFPELFGESEE